MGNRDPLEVIADALLEANKAKASQIPRLIKANRKRALLVLNALADARWSLIHSAYVDHSDAV